MGGIDLSRSDMTLTNLLFSSLIEAAEADHKRFCQVHSQMTFAKRDPGSYFNLSLNTHGVLLLVFHGFGCGAFFVCLLLFI